MYLIKILNGNRGMNTCNGLKKILSEGTNITEIKREQKTKLLNDHKMKSL